MSAALTVVAWLVAGIGVLLTAFTLGFRSGFPPLLDAVRRFNRDVTNPRQLRRAGQPGAWASVIHHVGRASGTAYRTPVVAMPTHDGFVFALPYGPTSDWVRNVLAAGSATVEHDGHSIPAERPELLSTEQANDLFPASGQRMHRIYGVAHALVVHRADTASRPRAGAVDVDPRLRGSGRLLGPRGHRSSPPPTISRPRS